MNIRNAVQNASNVVMAQPASLAGCNGYKISTDFLYLDETNQYRLTDIAGTFGQVVSPTTFLCGNSAISAFDLGLLYSAFVAMHAAYVEEGAAIKSDYSCTPKTNIHACWFGKHCIVHSVPQNLILAITPADLHIMLTTGRRVTVKNFADTREFSVAREHSILDIDNTDGTSFTSAQIPDYIQRLYYSYFQKEASVVVDDVSTPWQEDSALGALIANSVGLSTVESVLTKYQMKTVVDSVVVRTDLICTPTKRYKSTQDFLGSLCYTDKHNIALAVNCRANLFVHCPWFDGMDSNAVNVEVAPKFQEFYDINEECERITAFANSVVYTPPSVAQFTAELYESIKDAFYAMELPRLKFTSVLGRIVIPEPVLSRALSSAAWDSLYAIVPVGSIGSNVICKNDLGLLTTVKVAPLDSSCTWDMEDYFYDITGVFAK